MSSYCWTFTLWPLSLFIHIVYGRFTGIEAILRLLWWKWSLDNIINMWNSMLHTMCKFECIISNIWKIISLTTPRSFICQMALKILVKGTPSYVSWGIECHANINTENRELSWSEICRYWRHQILLWQHTGATGDDKGASPPAASEVVVTATSGIAIRCGTDRVSGFDKNIRESRTLLTWHAMSGKVFKHLILEVLRDQVGNFN